MAKDIREVSISNLDLDLENARFENQAVNDQREAIQYLLSIDLMANKIAQLVEHIAKHGEDPSELPLIIPHPTKSRSYVVVEGNRRLLAFKLLHNPDLCPPSAKSLRKKLKTALSNIKTPLSRKIQCSWVKDRAEANMWIEIKHTGENSGVGRVEWDGSARDAFREKQKGAKSVGRIILDYINNDPHFDSALKAFSKTMSITNLTRFFGGSEVKDALKYRIRKGELELQCSIESFRKVLEAIIFRFKEDGLTVSDIYSSEDRRNFIENRIEKKLLPGMSGAISERNPATDVVVDNRDNDEEQEKNNSSNTSSSAPDLDEPSQTAGPKRVSAQQSNLRKRLINFSIKISHPRINNVYLELKNKLDVIETPNAASVLFRVFLELTTDYALTDLSLNTKSGVGKDSKLRLKIDTVVEKLLDKQRVDKKNAQDIKHLTAANSFNMGNVDALHRFIHGSSQPLAKDLNDMMDNWKPYFLAVWDYDAEMGSGSGQRQTK